MAPITEETVNGLKDTIAKLEARVAQLEDRVAQGGDGSKPKSLGEQMRIILMGPPGAGSSLRSLFFFFFSGVASMVLTDDPDRQGNSGAQD